MIISNTMTKLLINEFNEEIASTRRILERVPEHKLTWTPHPKSMTLGQLALHIAIIPGALTDFLSELIREVPSVPLPEATSLIEILSELDKSERVVMEYLSIWEGDDLMADWKMTQGEQIIMTLPRIQMLRSAMLNHWYHHRGQLTVYLRLLDVPLPPVYGSTADEDPLG